MSSTSAYQQREDDAAGQAIANRFTRTSKYEPASRNANDGISIAQTTEGAERKSTTTCSVCVNWRFSLLTAQLPVWYDSIEAEITQRLNEIDRVSGQTRIQRRESLAQDNTLTIEGWRERR
ncbi:hypothetical protein KCP69_18100 [Salmonella enterica subsp. enterica]|nr:hypothetical protein KCP69_18100 [Salmonella enterica subsp. enterica]